MRALHLLIVGLAVGTTACGVDSGRAAESGSRSAEIGLVADSLSLRRVWAGSDFNFYASEPSPDGRLVSEIDWSTGDLAVRDLATGQMRRVTNKGPWEESVDYAEFSSFSPDGQRLAYSWFSDEKKGYQLRTIALDGTGMRVLVDAHPDLQYIAAEDWSPDGRMVLATVFRADRSSQIAIVSVADGAMRVMKTSDWRHMFVGAFSPDSRMIAYDFQPDEEARQRDIFVMPVDGSRETLVVGGPAHDVLLGWLADGSGILFYSDRHHTKGIWRQAIQDGRAVGDPVLLQSDVWQLFPLGFSSDAYYFGVTTEAPQVHTATIDLEQRRVVVPPAAVQEPGSGLSSFGAWSRDGRFLAYLRRSQDDRATRLVIRPVSGEEGRELRLGLTDPAGLEWMPDGHAVAMFGVDDKGRHGVYRVDVRTGAATLLAAHSLDHSEDMRRYSLSPDASSIVFKRKRGEAAGRGMRQPGNLIVRDLATGRDRVLHEFVSTGRTAVSPDGRFYVTREIDLDEKRSWMVVGRMDGSGTPRPIYETTNRLLQNRAGYQWTPDGRHVVVVEQERGGTRSRLLMIPADGGKPTVLLEWPEEMLDMRLSADGRHVSFGSGRSRGEIWRVERIPGMTPVKAASR